MDIKSFLNIGKAALDPVSNLPKVLGLSYPNVNPYSLNQMNPTNQAS